MGYLETDCSKTDYLEKAAIARQLKARIFGLPVAAADGLTGAFSIVHRLHTHLLPVAAPPAPFQRAHDDPEEPREDAA